MKKKKFSFSYNDYKHTLTPEILKNLGFTKAIDSLLNNEVWRIKVPYYHSIIQIELHDLPISNPNCGILSLHTPEEKNVEVYGSGNRKKLMTFKEQTTPIAWYVHTPERLHQLITVLTYQCA